MIEKLLFGSLKEVEVGYSNPQSLKQVDYGLGSCYASGDLRWYNDSYFTLKATRKKNIWGDYIQLMVSPKRRVSNHKVLIFLASEDSQGWAGCGLSLLDFFFPGVKFGGRAQDVEKFFRSHNPNLAINNPLEFPNLLEDVVSHNVKVSIRSTGMVTNASWWINAATCHASSGDVDSGLIILEEKGYNFPIRIEVVKRDNSDRNSATSQCDSACPDPGGSPYHVSPASVAQMVDNVTSPSSTSLPPGFDNIQEMATLQVQQSDGQNDSNIFVDNPAVFLHNSFQALEPIEECTEVGMSSSPIPGSSNPAPHLHTENERYIGPNSPRQTQMTNGRPNSKKRNEAGPMGLFPWSNIALRWAHMARQAHRPKPKRRHHRWPMSNPSSREEHIHLRYMGMLKPKSRLAQVYGNAPLSQQANMLEFSSTSTPALAFNSSDDNNHEVFSAPYSSSRGVISYHYSPANLQVVWNLHLRRAPRDWELPVIAELFSMIHGVTFLNEEDEWAWRWSPNRFFSISSFYEHLEASRRQERQDTIQPFPHTLVWSTPIPSKVKFFFWCALLNKIQTREQLTSRGMDVSTECPLCGNFEETTSHLFLVCDTVKFVWTNLVGNIFDIIEVLSNTYSLENLLQQWPHVRGGNFGKKLWRILAYATTWIIWTTRNEVVFRQK
ncbi:hypothetical protein IFM89_016828 [Coptis chinensis]|uniref:Reverse transcriptase zinc-binding domain-containing protein n=1 Tax=Coptis chinensis TaxID=261450 RepID=A0A835LBZ9_9MAGN|nr:hypothetical protein IFM89_016828 [Coptis chinensis]